MLKKLAVKNNAEKITTREKKEKCILTGFYWSNQLAKSTSSGAAPRWTIFMRERLQRVNSNTLYISIAEKPAKIISLWRIVIDSSRFRGNENV